VKPLGHRTVTADARTLATLLNGNRVATLVLDYHEVQIAAGVITATLYHHVVQAQAGVIDDLTTIAGLAAGDALLLLPYAGHEINVIHTTGGATNIHLTNGANFRMIGTGQILLVKVGADWYEIIRNN
jgi:hypothetical protein